MTYENYMKGRGSEFITQSDILNDVFDYDPGGKHDEFLEWAGKILGVTFTFDGDECMYVIGERRES